MRFVEERAIPVGAIAVGKRLRKLDASWVEVIAASIGMHGLKQPIGCYAEGDRFKLTYGAHRLAAVQRNGETSIRANIYEPETDDPEAEARRDEIIENLARRELSALDRAANLAELKRIHEQLYPETKRGVAGGKARQGSATDILSFAEAAAEKTGLSPRHIRRAVALHEGLGARVREQIADLPIADNASELRALSKLAPDLQSRVVAALRAGEARKVKAALALIHGEAVKPNPDHAAFEALLKAWNRAGAKARRRFLREIGANIEKSGT